MNGLFNEMHLFQRRRRERRPTSSSISTNSAGRTPTTTTPPAGRWRATRPSPGRSRSPSSYGGTRNGLVVHWPKGIEAKDEVRSQWHHVIDVAPTVLEAAGLPEPKSVDGTPQTPIQGVSMIYSFDDPKAKDRHLDAIFRDRGNRAIYHDGWLAGTIHRAPWEAYAARHADGRRVGALRHAQRLQPRA